MSFVLLVSFAHLLFSYYVSCNANVSDVCEIKFTYLLTSSVTAVVSLAQHVTVNFRNQSFWAINYTGTDNQNKNKITHAPETQKKRDTKTVLAKLNSGLVAFYDIQPGSNPGEQNGGISNSK